MTKTFENLIGKLAIILAFALLIFALFSYCDYNLIDKKYETPVEVNIPGRSLIISTFNNGANVHFLEHLIPLWNRNTEGVSNIYIESALNGREINTLKRAIVSNGLVWGTTWNLGNIQKTSSFERDELIDRAAQLFGLSSIVTYAESSSINYLSKNELFNDKIKLAHRVYDIEDEKFYSQSGGFLISKKTGKVYLVDFGGVDYFEISDNVFNENNVLRDELLLCDNMSFYFLRKNPSLDFNSYSYTIKSLSEVRNIISDSKFECINGLKFPKINEDSYLGYSSFWKTKLINIKSIKRTDVNSSMAEEWNLRYYIYELNSSFKEKISILHEDLKFIDMDEKDWKDFSYNWFLGENFSQLYIRGVRPEGYVEMSDRVSVENIVFGRERISFSVESDKKAPILIKVSYFPNWKAYENGKETKIYEVSPHLMMVYANGPIELKYEKLFIDWIGILGSLAGLIWVVGIIWRNKHETE